MTRADFVVRRAGAEDLATIAQHRAAMFSDMGILPAAAVPELIEQTIAYLQAALPSGEYLGWLAADAEKPDSIIGGAGVQRRRVLPFPNPEGAGRSVASGRQGLVLNVYTEPAWRRRGVARRLMEEVLAWAREECMESLVLHASSDGRALYEELGFLGTNEMRLTIG
ncbi:MAG TPA: GNAT family N-acetyltransferase [Gemmatimonadales bacterium]|jgi:GNAT superfamily N-acetyltransferase|nr:GNAT family N-acetyltransferase [Gemmatimonadales bacterium]